MASQQDLASDLSVGLSEVHWTLKHYNLGDWNEYLLVRRPGCPESFIVLRHPSDTSDVEERLVAFHKDLCKHER